MPDTIQPDLDVPNRSQRYSWHGHLSQQQERNVSKNDTLNTFSFMGIGRKERNVFFNNALNTFYLRLYGFTHMVKDHLAREETRCHHMGYS